MQDPPAETAPPPPLKHVEFKAGMLLALVLLLICGSVAYVLYARGAFENTQELKLVADDSEGVTVGMDLTFAGFPIGRVRRIELADDGRARIIVDVATKDVNWLRASSIFTMERGLVGDTKLRAFTGVQTDPPLPPGAERPVLRGDVSAEIPKLVATMQSLVENLDRLSRPGSSISASLDNVKTLTDGFKGKYGALGAVLGGDENAQKIVAALDRTNALLARGDALLGKTDALVGKADQRIFGARGVMDDAQATVQQLNALLADARASLKKVDAVLVEAQAVGANARVATNDLQALRGDVEASLRKVDGLVDEINRKWPFKRDREIKLP
jgi:phospholipid/cholesterol/gamma-HCH transport system substrate-binding protein